MAAADQAYALAGEDAARLLARGAGLFRFSGDKLAEARAGGLASTSTRIAAPASLARSPDASAGSYFEYYSYIRVQRGARRSLALPVCEDIPADGAALADLMRHDKKAVGDTLPLILLRGIGAAFMQHDVDLADVARFLDQQLQAH